MAEANKGSREHAAWYTSSHRSPPVRRCRHPRRQGHVLASGARSGVHACGGRRLTPGRTGPGRPATLRAAAYAVRRLGTRPAHSVPGRSSTVTAARRGPGIALRGSARWRAGRHREQRAGTAAGGGLVSAAPGCPRVVALCGVQGWVREVRELVFALDADAAGQQQGRQLARQAALRGKQVAGVPAAGDGPEGRERPQAL